LRIKIQNFEYDQLYFRSSFITGIVIWGSGSGFSLLDECGSGSRSWSKCGFNADPAPIHWMWRYFTPSLTEKKCRNSTKLRGIISSFYMKKERVIPAGPCISLKEWSHIKCFKLEAYSP
jgi:hypothetical protein